MCHISVFGSPPSSPAGRPADGPAATACLARRESCTAGETGRPPPAAPRPSSSAAWCSISQRRLCPRKRTVGDDALVAGPVGDLPGLADGQCPGADLAVQRLETSSAPDSLLEDGMKGEGIQHQQVDGMIPSIHSLSFQSDDSREAARARRSSARCPPLERTRFGSAHPAGRRRGRR